MAHHYQPGSYYANNPDVYLRNHPEAIAQNSMDDIDPSLINFQYSIQNYGYQQTYQVSEQKPLQRYIGESTQMGPLRGSQIYQRSISNLGASLVPHSAARTNSPTPSMYSHGITGSSADSPVEEELVYDAAAYSPVIDFGFSDTYGQQAHTGSHFLHDLAIGNDANIPQYALPPNASFANHVNMSQVQNYADYGDEGYSMQGGGGNEFIEVDSSNLKVEDGNSYRYADEGLGTSIQDANSQHVETPYTNDDFDADADLDDFSPAASPASDTDYMPKAKPARTTVVRKSKRARDSSSAQVQNLAKRARTTKAATSPQMIEFSNAAPDNNTSCNSCSQNFANSSLLAKHVSKEHTKAFVCVFSFAGCNSIFATKNEWKRHVFSQHCNFQTWICDIGECAKPSKGKNASSASSTASIAVGAHFNRKDLYTQHLRRMHTPRSAEKGGKGSTAMAAWDENIKAMQESNCHQTRALPEELTCPLASCGVVFEGKNCWDDRMEHVGKHLEGVASANTAAILGGTAGAKRVQVEEFDQGDDEKLVEWAERVGIVVFDRLKHEYSFVGDGSRRRVEVTSSGGGSADSGRAKRGGRGREVSLGSGDDDADADAEGEDDLEVFVGDV